MKKNKEEIALDKKSVRTIDENGFLHVEKSHITKANICPYYGYEIPGYESLKLEPDTIYYGLRDPNELKKSLKTWEGVPLHIEHHIDSAENPQKLTRVGSIGTEIVWNKPYVDAPLIVWDKQAIELIENGSFRELSCSYRYDPDFTAGYFEGKKYDFVMRNIRGNHVALVEEGRAGHDVLVADEALKKGKFDTKKFLETFKKLLVAKDSLPKSDKVEARLAKAIVDAFQSYKWNDKNKNFSTDSKATHTLKSVLEEIKEKMSESELKKVADSFMEIESILAKDGELKAMDEIRKEVMNKAGCDTENESEVKAFEAGIEYGESIFKGNDKKVSDEEIDISAIKKAMDKAGCDSENDAETKAFEAGIELAKSEAANDTEEEKKAVDEENAEKKAQDEEEKKEETNTEKKGTSQDNDEVIEKIVAALPELNEEQILKLKAALSVSDAVDETPQKGETMETAVDKALKKKDILYAKDVKKILEKAERDAINRNRKIYDACKKVRPLVGEIDPLAFDSASKVYSYVLKQSGIKAEKYDESGYEGMIDVMLKEHSNAPIGGKNLYANDSKVIPEKGPFSMLKNITISE